MLRLLQISGGVVLMAAALLDVFLTVLYARAGASILSQYASRLGWRAFRGVARMSGPRGKMILSMCGPTLLVLMVFLWASLLTVGASLILHPFLGSAIQADQGTTPTDFVTALFVAGNSMSIVGSSGFSPRTSGFKLLFLLNSLIGMTVISLTLTYLMQIHNALHRRNVAGLDVHLLSGATGDAAEMIRRIAPQGRFDAAHDTLSRLAYGLANIKETHHFYPVLLYFRFPETYCSVSYTAGMVLDCASLIETGMDRDSARWLQECGAVSELWDASLLLIGVLERLVRIEGRASAEPSQSEREAWSTRYYQAIERFQQSGIETTRDPKAGVEEYIRIRAEWDGRIQRLAATMLYDAEDVDPARATARGALYPPPLPTPATYSNSGPRRGA